MDFVKNNYTRKEISKELNIGVETLRYYEKIGIIPMPARTEAGYRIYSEEDLVRLQFIMRSKELGFTLNEIFDILQILDGDNISGSIIYDTILAKIEELSEKINSLRKLRDKLNYCKDNTNLNKIDILKNFYNFNKTS